MKHFKRCSALALALMLSVSLLSLGVSADNSVDIYQDIFEGHDCFFDDFNQRLGSIGEQHSKPTEKVTIKASDYENYILWKDNYYEIVGINSSSKHELISNGVMEYEIPAYPVKGTQKEKDAWQQLYGDITVAYALHEHDLTDAPWHYDNNYHWKNCTECGRRVFLNWHSDHNEDGVCDLCGNAIKYYNITVKDAPGGKVTLSAEKGEMNDRINVTVTPDAGYHLDTLKFFNNNAKHSQLTRWEDKAGSEYHFVILNWDIDVEAVFVKD